MTDRIEKIFTKFANEEEEALNKMGMTKTEFIENAKKWSETEDGKLEIQKFILTQEISSLKKQISEIEENIVKKEKSIKEIEIELSNL
ncbi:hypothetical protein [Methanosphaera sp.]|uniref:hypothetical protein n=1 Tax=Methanosphaera sp. TaxID=2666342 RepID=UPI0026DF5151|nr:hypothetical protein [Methanosphaera sp.]MDO5822083.1 hypothetical protein [Methanosphaera sp.]